MRLINLKHLSWIVPLSLFIGFLLGMVFYSILQISETNLLIECCLG